MQCRLFIWANGHARHLGHSRGLRGAAGEAVHGSTFADTTRIEPDDVEPLAQRLGQRGVLLRQRHDSGVTRAAGVEEEGSDPMRLVGRGDPRHGQGDRRPVRLVVIQRNIERGALLGGQFGGRTRLPGDLGCGDDRDCRVRRRGGRGRGGHAEHQDQDEAEGQRRDPVHGYFPPAN